MAAQPEKTPAPEQKPTSAGSGGKDPKKAKGSGSCRSFPFDARSKPIVEQMLSAEQKRMKSFFGKKPKVPISEIVTMLGSKSPRKMLAPAVIKCISFYKRLDDEGNKYLEVLGRFLLEAASLENADAAYQHYLIYEALDAFSTAIQISEHRIEISAESMVLACLKVAGSSSYPVEKEIHKTMNAMLTKGDLNDLDLHDRIVKLCIQGKRYYEAYYHLMELERIMKITSRSMYLLKEGELQFRKAAIFQQIVDFYLKVAAANEEEKKRIFDSGKLQSFIHRFNLDNPHSHLEPLAGSGPLPLNKTLSSLINACNSYYTQAGEKERFAHRHKAFYAKAYNHMSLDKGKAAIDCLIKGMVALDKSPLKTVDKGNEKIKMLEYLIKICEDDGTPRQIEEYTKQLAALRKSVRSKESKKRDEDANRKEKEQAS